MLQKVTLNLSFSRMVLYYRTAATRKAHIEVRNMTENNDLIRTLEQLEKSNLDIPSLTVLATTLNVEKRMKQIQQLKQMSAKKKKIDKLERQLAALQKKIEDYITSQNFRKSMQKYNTEHQPKKLL